MRIALSFILVALSVLSACSQQEEADTPPPLGTANLGADSRSTETAVSEARTRRLLPWEIAALAVPSTLEVGRAWGDEFFVVTDSEADDDSFHVVMTSSETTISLTVYLFPTGPRAASRYSTQGRGGSFVGESASNRFTLELDSGLVLDEVNLLEGRIFAQVAAFVPRPDSRVQLVAALVTQRMRDLALAGFEPAQVSTLTSEDLAEFDTELLADIRVLRSRLDVWSERSSNSSFRDGVLELWSSVESICDAARTPDFAQLWARISEPCGDVELGSGSFYGRPFILGEPPNFFDLRQAGLQLRKAESHISGDGWERAFENCVARNIAAYQEQRGGTPDEDDLDDIDFFCLSAAE